MGNKDKTISFRVSQEKFEALRDIAEERDISLSKVFREYVDMLVAHDGQVEVVPEHAVADGDGDEESFPPRVKVPKSFVREHERLELEAGHLREQLEEYKRFATKLQEQADENDAEDVVQLEDLDGDHEDEDDSPYRIGNFEDV